MKKCQYCSEEIQDEAIKCKHCGSNLSENQQAQPASPINIATPKKGKKFMLTGGGMIALGIPLLIIPPVGALLLLFGLIFFIYGKFTHWYNWK